MIAALYVEKGGCYYGLDGVDPWDEERDARAYQGPYPVVAHPPCQRWGNLAYANYARWGGEHNRPGNDGGCFKCALSDVRQWGGVLEHPAGTRAWEAFGLEKPSPDPRWQALRPGEWVCEVWQSACGHKARKRTWLFYHGMNTPHCLRWDRLPGTHQVGFQDQRGKDRNKPTLSKKEANATPLPFRDELIQLAERANT